jgi:hypothetical protein
MTPDAVMHFDVRGDLLDSARDCEAEVFLSAYGNTREQLAEEYDPYEDSTVFLAVADHRGDVMATVRLLAPGGRAGLKTLADIKRDPWNVDGARSAAAAQLDPHNTWEIATLAVRRDTGSDSRLSLALYHGLVAVCRANEMSSFVAVLDQRVRRLLSIVGLPTQPLPGTRPAPYLGSPSSTPVYAHCAPVLDDQRRNFPDAYRLVTLGVGLDGISVPPPEAFILRPRERELATAGSGRHDGRGPVPALAYGR